MPLACKLPDRFARAGEELSAVMDLLSHQLYIMLPGGANVSAVREYASQERVDPAACVFQQRHFVRRGDAPFFEQFVVRAQTDRLRLKQRTIKVENKQHCCHLTKKQDVNAMLFAP
jgi:hypothetical protein